MVRWCLPNEIGKQPVLVVERSLLTYSEIIAEGKSRRLDAETTRRIRETELCMERWAISKPTVYIVHPCRAQAYLASNMQQAHYQLTQKDRRRLVAMLKKAQQRTPAIRIIEIRTSRKAYDDDFFHVRNGISDAMLDQLETKTLEQQLREHSKVDGTRNNASVDLGFTGHRNSERRKKYLGITHPLKHQHTMEPWSVSTFTSVTDVLDALFGKKCSDMYNDADRNALFSFEIGHGNRVEALRLGETSGGCTLLRIHWDSGNCTAKSYAYVGTISWWLFDETRKTMVRHALTSYGKDCAATHMKERREHSRAILVLEKLYIALPEMQKRSDSSIFPKGADRIAYDFAFLEKTVFYSLYASAISAVFEAYPILKHSLEMACGFLVNVVMSESPDHYWQICQELLRDKRAVGGLAIDECNGSDFAFAFSCEIFRRKRHSGCALAEVAVSYPLRQRHAPAVNKPPSGKQVSCSTRALVVLVRELKLLLDWNVANSMHYYGRSSEFIVEECFGAGHLTAQHILGVGTAIGLFPVAFFTVAEIGTTTRTWAFLKWAFGYQDRIAYEQTNTLLRATSVYLSVSVLQVEELCCYLCKLLSPRVSGYEKLPCTLNMEQPVFDFARSKATGDVVYGGMFLYQMQDDECLYALGADGTLELSEGLLNMSVFTRVDYMGSAGFWQRAYSSKRSFHYRRNAGKSLVRNLKEYFFTSSEWKTVRRQQSLAWNSKEPYAAELVARSLVQPSFETVLMGYNAREPLNLKQVVWNTIGLDGQFYKKSMFVTLYRQLQPYRPPSVARGSRTNGRLMFNTCGLRLKDNSVWWPDVYFDMYTTGHNFPGTDQNTELVYPCNYSRVLKETIDDTVHQKRWFSRLEDAEQFVLWAYLFGHLHDIDISDRQTRSMLFLDVEDGPMSSTEMEKRRIVVDRTEEVHIYYDTLAFRSRSVRCPVAVSVKYPRGGMAVWRCNEFGQRISGAFCRRPYPSARSCKAPGLMYEMIRVVGHRTGKDRTSVFSGCSINLMVQWVTMEVTEEPFSVIFEDSPTDVVSYGHKKGLLSEPGWSRARKLSLVDPVAQVPRRRRPREDSAQLEDGELRTGGLLKHYKCLGA